jgi:hypothetical protein
MQNTATGVTPKHETMELEQNYAAMESGRDFVGGYGAESDERTDYVVGSILSYRLRILSDDDPP